MRWTLLALFFLTIGRALACPFCSPGDSDLFTDLQSAQAGALVTIVEAGKYRLEEPLIGSVSRGKVVLAPRLATRAVPLSSFVFLTTSSNPNQPYWTGPARMLDAEELNFVRSAAKLVNSEPAERWDLAAKYLEHKSEQLAAAAYAILAAAPLKEVQKRVPVVGEQRLISMIKDPKTPSGRRALYIMMALSILKPSDASWLRSEIWKEQPLSPFSALLPPLMIAYMQTGGQKAVAELEKEYLKPEATPTATFGVTGAFLFVGEHTDSKPLKESTLEIFRRELEHPQRGIFAVAPLAVWGDYSVAERVENLFTLRADAPWARRTVVRYFRTFKTAESEQALARLAKLDSKLVEATKKKFTAADFGF